MRRPRKRNPSALTSLASNKLALGLTALVAAYLFFKWQAGKAVTSIVDATQAAGEAAGGEAYTLVHGDTNATQQVEVTDIKSALQAAGYPRVGSDTYNAIMLQFNRPDLVVNNALTGQGGG